jgi:hypothetical protein
MEALVNLLMIAFDSIYAWVMNWTHNQLKTKGKVTGFYFQQVMGTIVTIRGDLVKYIGLFFHKVAYLMYEVP